MIHGMREDDSRSPPGNFVVCDIEPADRSDVARRRRRRATFIRLTAWFAPSRQYPLAALPGVPESSVDALGGQQFVMRP